MELLINSQDSAIIMHEDTVIQVASKRDNL